MEEKKNYMDLRKPSQLVDFNKMLKKFEKKGIFILIHADFCGPCQHYKKSVWNDLVANTNRKAGLAGIHYDQLENSPFANANIKGYPSVIYVTQNGTIKKVSNFNDSETGSLTNAMPSDSMRNKELMEKLINSEPHEVQAALPSMEPLPPKNELEESSDEDDSSSDEEDEPEFSEDTTKLRNKVTANEAVQNVQKNAMPVIPSKKGTPPKGVILDSQKESSPLNFNPEVPNADEPKSGKGTAVGGGSLYTSLLRARRLKGSRRTHRVQKKTRKSKHKKTTKRRKY